jgi:hypothetical protein
MRGTFNMHGEMGNKYRILVRKPERKCHLGDPDADGRIN